MEIKRMFGIFAVLLLVLSPVVAQDTGATEDIEIEELPLEGGPGELEGDPGVTPDSPLWGIDVALDRIRLALATGPDKAKVGLRIAEERLLEVRAMAEAGNAEAADKAEEAHDESLANVVEDVEEFNGEAGEDEIAELEDRIDRHLAALALLRDRLEASDLPEDAKLRLKAKFSEADGASERIFAKIDNKRTRLRIMQQAEGFKEKLEVKVRGDLTGDQRALVKELAKSLDESEDHARVKLECKDKGGKRSQDREFDCDFKVRGTLTDEQSVLVNELIASLLESETRAKVEFTHKFQIEDREDSHDEDDEDDHDEEDESDEEDDRDEDDDSDEEDDSDESDEKDSCETDSDCDKDESCDNGRCKDLKEDDSYDEEDDSDEDDESEDEDESDEEDDSSEDASDETNDSSSGSSNTE